MIWVTTLDDKTIEDRMDEFKKTFPLFTNKTISQYRELLPASLLYGTKGKEFIDDCNDEEIQMLHDFFQGCYSFTIFHFIINLVYSPIGPLYYEISKESRGYYAKNIIRKWTNKIKAQTFQSDRPINKDTDFMRLLKQLPPLERFDFLRPPSLFGDFFRDLYDEVFFNDDFLLKNNGVDFNTLMSSVKEAKLLQKRKHTAIWKSFFAFYNHKKQSLLFHFTDYLPFSFKITNPSKRTD